MAGIRIGTLYTENRDVVEALGQLGSFHGISGTTQHQVAQLLQDRGMDQIILCANTLHRFIVNTTGEKNPHVSSLLVKTSPNSHIQPPSN